MGTLSSAGNTSRRSRHDNRFVSCCATRRAREHDPQTYNRTVSPRHDANAKWLDFHDTIEEMPVLDSEEIWEFLNVTVDEHPIHLHLVNFEIIDRQEIEYDHSPTYLDTFHETFHTWLKDTSSTKPPLPPGMAFKAGSTPVPSDDYEREPKDTVRVPSDTLTRIKTRFRLHTGLYMYHCHILEHEDMEMMRPLLVVPSGMPIMSHGSGHHGTTHPHGLL